jgi:hypothetical protein
MRDYDLMKKSMCKISLILITTIAVISSVYNPTFVNARKYTRTLMIDEEFVVGPKWIVGRGSILWSFSSSNPNASISAYYIGETGSNLRDSYDWWVSEVSDGSYTIDSGLINVQQTSKNTLVFMFAPDINETTEVSIEVVFNGHGKFLALFITPSIVVVVAIGIFIGVVAILKRKSNSTY